MGFLSRFAQVAGFARALAAVDPTSIVLQSIRDVAIRIAGPPESAKNQVLGALSGPAAFERSTGVYLDLIEIGPSVLAAPADLSIIVVDPRRVREDQTRTHVASILARRGRVVIVVALDPNSDGATPMTSSDRDNAAVAFGVPRESVAMFYADDPARSKKNVAEAILAALPERQLALARGLPGLRSAIANRVVLDAAFANGQFAIVSSVPALIPLVGGLIAVGADIIVLTRNQATLVFQLAAIHGRRLDRPAQLVAEIAPVVGGAFVWRSAARALAALLPGAVGALPRGAIAFAGTYVLGQIANEYYRSARRPDPETIERFGREAAQEALRRVGSMAAGLSGWRWLLARVPGRHRPSD